MPADPEAWLFPDPDGKPVRQSAFYKRIFKPAVKTAHPNLFLVMKRLGHASMVTTTTTYGHLVGDVDAMLATALDDFNKQPDRAVQLPAALTPGGRSGSACARPSTPRRRSGRALPRITGSAKVHRCAALRPGDDHRGGSPRSW